MKRKTLTQEAVINQWLFRYHGITVQELVKKHPRLVKTPRWFTKYAVTQEQHDEWHEWFIKKLMWYTGRGRRYVERLSWVEYLNLAPSVKESKE